MSISTTQSLPNLLRDGLKRYFFGDDSWPDPPVCLICQNQVKFDEQMATYRCQCRMICHNQCLSEYNLTNDKCPICQTSQDFINDMVTIWINPYKIDHPKEFKMDLTQAKQTVNQLFKQLQKKALNDQKSLQLLIALNQEMFQLDPHYSYQVLCIDDLMSFFEYQPTTIESFFKIQQPLHQSLRLFTYKKRKYSLYPHYTHHLSKLLQIGQVTNNQESFENIFNYPGLCIAGLALYQLLTSSKMSLEPCLEIYVCGRNEEERQTALQYILSFFNSEGFEFDLLIYKNIININLKKPSQRLFQVIVTDYLNPVELIHSFNYSHSQFYFQDGHLYGTYDACLAVKTRTTYYKTSHRQAQVQIDSSNLLTAQSLGYQIVMPLNSQVQMNPLLKPTEILSVPDLKKEFKYCSYDHKTPISIQQIVFQVKDQKCVIDNGVIECQPDFLHFHLNNQTIPQIIDIIKMNPGDYLIQNVNLIESVSDEEADEVVSDEVVPNEATSSEEQIEQDPQDLPLQVRLSDLPSRGRLPRLPDLPPSVRYATDLD